MKNYIFCVDSDGCAMDTMTYKHTLFFGPLAADIFKVENKDSFLKEWNRVNLYARTRGINRFVGLVKGLEFAGVSSIERLKNWVETTNSLSNDALEEAILKSPSKDLELALEWSKQVNQAINTYTGPVKSFPGVMESLEKLSRLGEVYVVSSANKEAVLEEWTDQELMPYIKDLYCQERGKKEDVLHSLIASGNAPENIIMIGDSPGDLKAASLNGVYFYPILVGEEEASWAEFKQNVAEKFVSQVYSRETEAKFIDRFWKNLDEN